MHIGMYVYMCVYVEKYYYIYRMKRNDSQCDIATHTKRRGTNNLPQ